MGATRSMECHVITKEMWLFVCLARYGCQQLISRGLTMDWLTKSQGINVKKILAVINATYAVAKRKPEKLR